jgi:hypothetical protein
MTVIKIPLCYGEGRYGEYPYKNEWWKTIVIPDPISPITPKPDPDLIEGLEDESEMWLIDQYREDFLNG